MARYGEAFRSRVVARLLPPETADIGEASREVGVANLEGARTWAADFVRWYNHDHRHSGIRYVSPAQRHAGEDHAILAARHALYLRAQEQTPARWSGKTRNWTPIGAVTLNPERDSVIKAQLEGDNLQALAA